jgi:hypothetical protein
MKYAAILSLLFLFINNLPAEQRIELGRIGINGSFGIMNIKDLNGLADAWIKAKDDSSRTGGDSATHQGFSIPLNLEFGFQPFVSFTLWNRLVLGGKIDYLWSSHFYNSLFKDTLTIKLKTVIPAITGALKAGPFEIGGSALYAVSSVNWSDNFFGYSSQWNARGWGYEINLCLAPQAWKYMGTTISLGYRGLVVGDVYDNAGRKLYFAESGEPFTLSLSGFVMNVGIFFGYTYPKGGAK